MSLRTIGRIEIPDADGTEFDHGAFDPTTRRVFVAHTGRDRVQVINHDSRQHIATLKDFAGAAGVVAEEGQVLVTNRGSAELAWVDAHTLKTRAVYKTAPRPNGVAIVARSALAVVACIGDDGQGPELQLFNLESGSRIGIALPGRPRWCVTDAAGARVYLAIHDPSMILVASLPELTEMSRWPLPLHGAHGIDIDRERGLLHAACDGGALLEVDGASGKLTGEWPLEGEPDATFFNPSSGLVHVAIPEPGLVQSIHPRSGTIARLLTAPATQTTALVPPHDLYAFSPHGVLHLAEETQSAHSGVYKAGG
jgi:DNA-binding beta-propeller fold protein YncE